LGLSIGTIIIFNTIGIDKANDESANIIVSQMRESFSTKVVKVDDGAFESVIPVAYTCAITNTSQKPITFISCEIGGLIDKNRNAFVIDMGSFQSNKEIDVPFTVGPDECKDFTIIVGEPVGLKVVDILKQKFDINDYFDFYSAMKYLADNNIDIYGREIEYKNTFRYSMLFIDNSKSHIVFLRTGKGNSFSNCFGNYLVYPIE
jgi:hypothetical protein